MRGKWVESCYGEWAYRTDDGGVHARVFLRVGPYTVDPKRPWCCWTTHTEGNDDYETEAEAKRRAESRLERLLKATESLRD